MLRSYQCAGCTLLFCFIVSAVQAEGTDNQINSYCAVASLPGSAKNARLSGEIRKLAKEKNIQLEPETLNLYPELIYLSLLKGYTWPLNHLKDMGAEKRVKLCRAYETERLATMALRAEQAHVESFCESASQPSQHPDEMLIRKNAELALNMKQTINPEIAARYPLLINQQLTAESSKFCNSTQNELDNLESFGTEKRAKLCKILEKERLDLQRIDIKYRTEMVLIDVMKLN